VHRGSSAHDLEPVLLDLEVHRLDQRDQPADLGCTVLVHRAHLRFVQDRVGDLSGTRRESTARE
jgi:hypothetical protein